MTEENAKLDNAILTYSAEVDKILPALVQAKKGFARVLKGQRNDYYKSRFADISEVINSITPALLDNGLLFMQPKTITESGGKTLVGIRTHIWHESGQFICSESLIPFLPQKQGKSASKGADLHSLASLMTYCSRYFLLGIFGLAAEDDDGNAHVTMQRQPPPMPTPQQVTQLVSDISSLDADSKTKFNSWMQGLGCPSIERLTLSDFEVARQLMNRKIAKIKADNTPVPQTDVAAIKKAAQDKGIDEAGCVKWVCENTTQNITTLAEINSGSFVQLGTWIKGLPV